MRTFLALCIGYGFLASLPAENTPPLLSPSLYIFGYYGTSTADDPKDFAPGGHDPSRKDALVLQSAEPSISLRWGEYVQGFVTGIAYTDSNDDLEWEWEEYFLKLTDLPGGLEFRGGLMLSRLGFYNATHLHSWMTVDAPLIQSLFFGEDGLALEGGDFSMYMDTEQVTVLTIGYGQRQAHDHNHGHGSEEDDHDHDHGDDHDHDDDHGHESGDYNSYEEYRVQDDVITVGLRRDHVFNDFQILRGTLFGSMGDNELGESSWLGGAGLEYQWRENGYEPGGQSVRWRTQVVRFDGGSVEYHDHEDDHGHDDDHEEDHADDHEDDHDDDHAEEGGGIVSTWGITSEIEFQAHPRVHPFARFDYVGASEELDLPEWTRYTVGMTIPLTDTPHAFLRLQGNADERGDESEQSVWAQLGLSWGGGEVR